MSLEAVEIKCGCGWSVSVPADGFPSVAGLITRKAYDAHVPHCPAAPTEETEDDER